MSVFKKVLCMSSDVFCVNVPRPLEGVTVPRPLSSQVLATVCDMLCHIPSCTPPGTIFYDESSPPFCLVPFFVTKIVQFHCSPGGLIYDESSPPAMSQSFFQDKDNESTFPHPRPPCEFLTSIVEESMPFVQPVPLCEKDEVALFPSDLEVRDLFFDKSPSALFDFVKLSCVQCRRCFASASGLEFHMKDQHDIAISQNQQIVSSAPSPLKIVSVPPPELLQVGPCSGPPQCAPFSKLRPAKTWAAVAAKPALPSSQPWSGKLINFNTYHGPTPRRPIGARPYRPSNIRGQSSAKPMTTSTSTSAGSKKPKISFTPPKADPDDVSHVVLLPAKILKKNRRMFPCLHCDFKFRTVKSMDEHLVVHVLEDEFNRLHGIASTSNASDFDDFALPQSSTMTSRKKLLPAKAPASATASRKQKTLPIVEPASTTSSRKKSSPSETSTSPSTRPQVAAPVSVDVLPNAVVSSFSCHFCDQRGFPSKKALKYHLFRLHGQPMKKPSKPSLSTTSSQDQVSTSPATAISTSPSVVRHDVKIALSFPINGNIACPETGCNASFVSREWTCMKGLLIKHLRFAHRISIAVCEFKCDICHLDIQSKPRDHPCFANGCNPLVIEVEQLLAPPVEDIPLVEVASQNSDHADEPLFHFVQIFQDILSCDPSQDCTALLSEAYSQLVAVASNIVLPKEPVPASSTASRSINIDDPQQCQRLYKRNGRRAIREIQKVSGERCSLPPSIVGQFFSAVWRPSTSDPHFYQAASLDREEVLNLPLSVAEVMTAFRSCESTAPGLQCSHSSSTAVFN
ncbi:hypothetical protein CDAR_495341 [Caerostris darwini]|uniref:C2H2-type domain-containing protein n=1 Tax=Caerostris darwini TaxID=1538125 RepID=A0AAV4UX92_9ARAC|nr:hypothetical protein CDAR_495341 [Caerostris darwini]